MAIGAWAPALHWEFHLDVAVAEDTGALIAAPRAAGLHWNQALWGGRLSELKLMTEITTATTG